MLSLLPKSGLLGQRLAAHLLRRTTYNITIPRINTFANFTVEEAVNELFTLPPELSVIEPINLDTAESPALSPTDCCVQNTTASSSDPIPSTIGVPFLNGYANLSSPVTSLQLGQAYPPYPATTTEATYPSIQDRANKYVSIWWLHEAVQDTSIHHKMQFFLHSRFSISQELANSGPIYDYLRLLSYYSLRSYKELAKALCISNAMLRYLNGDTSTAANPNENFAREFLELFTIGKGPQAGPDDYTNYTESDIVEAAKIFSGWRVSNRFIANSDCSNGENCLDAVTGIPHANPVTSEHDATDKHFSHRFQNQVISGQNTKLGMLQEIDDFVEMVFAQDATAQFICRNLYRHFVTNYITEEVETEIINPLAAELKAGNYDLSPIVQRLLRSQHFYDEDNSEAGNEIVGSLVKSPLDLTLQIISVLNLPVPHLQNAPAARCYLFWGNTVCNHFLRRNGLDLFKPPSVAGYPPLHQAPNYDKAWFNTNTIIGRYGIPNMLISGEYIDPVSGATQLTGVCLDVCSLTDTLDLSPEAIVDFFTSYLLPEALPTERFNYFMDIYTAGLEDFDPDFPPSDIDNRVKQLLWYIMASVEYQLM